MSLYKQSSLLKTLIHRSYLPNASFEHKNGLISLSTSPRSSPRSPPRSSPKSSKLSPRSFKHSPELSKSKSKYWFPSSLWSLLWSSTQLSSETSSKPSKSVQLSSLSPSSWSSPSSRSSSLSESLSWSSLSPLLSPSLWSSSIPTMLLLPSSCSIQSKESIKSSVQLSLLSVITVLPSLHYNYCYRYHCHYRFHHILDLLIILSPHLKFHKIRITLNITVFSVISFVSLVSIACGPPLAW